MRKTIIITGAAGNLGTKLRAHLSARELRLLDLAPAGDPAIIEADVAAYDDSWARRFEGADAVVHLVGLAPGEHAWSSLAPAYLDAVENVYLAAARYGVKHVVFASSVWTMAAHRFGRGPIAADPIGDPGDHAYGAAKLFGERVGKTFADGFGISTVALRIGGCRAGDNEFCAKAPMSDWNQACWLSNRDFCDGAEKAIDAEVDGFAVVNLVSANPGSRWTLDEAERLIGFVPHDGERLQLSTGDRVRVAFARLCRDTLPGFMRRLAPAHW
jgi:hypothetical protein